MFNYLIDEKSGRVLLRVKGPIQTLPGQRIAQSKTEIPVRFARYDRETGTVVRIPGSLRKVAEREAQQRRDDRDRKLSDDLLRFKELWGKQDPELRELLLLMIEVPDPLLRASVSEEGR
tara:strand:+ start:1236 stop:1592 length:357 start_codon:yes stop_codon:yes gene_type:complete